LSKVIYPLPLGERARVRGKKGISNALQNALQVTEYQTVFLEFPCYARQSFHPHPFPPPSMGRVSLVFPYSPKWFFIKLLTIYHFLISRI